PLCEKLDRLAARSASICGYDGTSQSWTNHHHGDAWVVTRLRMVPVIRKTHRTALAHAPRCAPRDRHPTMPSSNREPLCTIIDPRKQHAITRMRLHRTHEDNRFTALRPAC